MQSLDALYTERGSAIIRQEGEGAAIRATAFLWQRSTANTYPREAVLNQGKYVPLGSSTESGQNHLLLNYLYFARIFFSLDLICL